jgi:hypothetical protein
MRGVDNGIGEEGKRGWDRRDSPMCVCYLRYRSNSNLSYFSLVW